MPDQTPITVYAALGYRDFKDATRTIVSKLYWGSSQGYAHGFNDLPPDCKVGSYDDTTGWDLQRLDITDFLKSMPKHIVEQLFPHSTAPTPVASEDAAALVATIEKADKLVESCTNVFGDAPFTQNLKSVIAALTDFVRDAECERDHAVAALDQLKTKLRATLSSDIES